MSALASPHAGALPAPRARSSAPLQTLVGFFFAYRFALTFLGFRSDPRIGTMVNLGCLGLLFVASLFFAMGSEGWSVREWWSMPTLRWLFAYVAFSGASLLWTGAESVLDAAGLWSGMALELATALLVVRPPFTVERVEAVLKGFVLGMMFVDAVAWLSPTLEDLRIGDYDFLHPNILGLYSAENFFLAQYLSLRHPKWRWACLFLAATMLRSLSKTSIIAFVLAEAFHLLRDRRMSRRTKVQLVLAAAGLLAAFWALFASYLEIYATTGSGTQPETLTGRTAIWAVASLMAIETPWIGHGFYSLRSLIPAFGVFEPWHAHNELLQEFFEYGVVGVAITVAIYATFVRAARRVAKLDRQQPLAGLVFVLVFFAVIHGLTESINFGLTLPLWLFAVLAAALQATQEPQPC